MLSISVIKVCMSDIMIGHRMIHILNFIFQICYFLSITYSIKYVSFFPPFISWSPSPCPHPPSVWVHCLCFYICIQKSFSWSLTLPPSPSPSFPLKIDGLFNAAMSLDLFSFSSWFLNLYCFPPQLFYFFKKKLF